MYNTTMNSVIIEGPEQAIRAGTWADRNIQDGWELDMPEPFGNRYHFIFTNPADASLFALKWVQ